MGLWRHFGPQNVPNLNHFRQKWPILTKLTPLMTFLTAFLSINLTEIIFRNLQGQNYWTNFPKFWHMTVFLPPNYAEMSQFWPFSAKMSYFELKWAFLTQLNPLMTFLITVMLINPTKMTLETVLRKNNFFPPSNF